MFFHPSRVLIWVGVAWSLTACAAWRAPIRPPPVIRGQPRSRPPTRVSSSGPRSPRSIGVWRRSTIRPWATPLTAARTEAERVGTTPLSASPRNRKQRLTAWLWDKAERSRSRSLSRSPTARDRTSPSSATVLRRAARRHGSNRLLSRSAPTASTSLPFPPSRSRRTASQVGNFGALDPTNLYDLAGKDPLGYGTPFDLSELAGVSPLLNVNDVTEVRLVHCVGDINPAYATYDSLGNVINAPWPSPSTAGSEGFVLAGVGVTNAAPEPGTFSLAITAVAVAAVFIRRRRALVRNTPLSLRERASGNTPLSLGERGRR